MNFKEIIGLIYGVFMGTSTIYIKAPRTFEFPKREIKLGEFSISLGRTRNQVFASGRLIDPKNIASINGAKVISVYPGKDVIWLESVRALVMGDLFYNRVHPPAKEIHAPRAQVWIQILEKLAAEYKPEVFIPAEGELIGSTAEFVRYLQDLSNPSLTHEELLKKYAHFSEIQGYSSLTENFDYFRQS